ncbi:MAG: pilus assembly FimT family protein [Noviherbaspirillum sp.]
MKTSGGFTLVELVMILIMVGILAVTATPRMFNRQTFDARAFFDQTQAMLRYGQKVAIGQQRPVFFNANAGNGAVCLTFVADADCASASGVPNPADGASFRRTAPDGVSLSASVSFSFTSLGQPFPDAPVTFGIVGDNTTRTITVERETGYVH